MFDRLTLVIMSEDLTGVVTSWNAAAERIFGYCAEEAIGRAITFIIPPDRHHEETDVLRRIRLDQRSPISRRCA